MTEKTVYIVVQQLEVTVRSTVQCPATPRITTDPFLASSAPVPPPQKKKRANLSCRTPSTSRRFLSRPYGSPGLPTVNAPTPSLIALQQEVMLLPPRTPEEPAVTPRPRIGGRPRGPLRLFFRCHRRRSPPGPVKNCRHFRQLQIGAPPTFSIYVTSDRLIVPSLGLRVALVSTKSVIRLSHRPSLRSLAGVGGVTDSC